MHIVPLPVLLLRCMLRPHGEKEDRTRKHAAHRAGGAGATCPGVHAGAPPPSHASLFQTLYVHISGVFLGWRWCLRLCMHLCTDPKIAWIRRNSITPCCLRTSGYVLVLLQVVLPYWRPLKVTKQIQRHRLLHPDQPPVVIHPQQLQDMQDESATKCCGTIIDPRRFLGSTFDFVFKCASPCSLSHLWASVPALGHLALKLESLLRLCYFRLAVIR